MADLLECLLQIKGLRHSVERLGALAEMARANREPARTALTRTAADLVTAEQRWQSVLAGVLPGRVGSDESAASSDPADAVEAFRLARVFTLELLDSCSAEDLAASTTVSGLGRVTVADIVAHMLAHDTERLEALAVIVQPG